jgi:hypothetical protein
MIVTLLECWVFVSFSTTRQILRGYGVAVKSSWELFVVGRYMAATVLPAERCKCLIIHGLNVVWCKRVTLIPCFYSDFLKNSYAGGARARRLETPKALLAGRLPVPPRFEQTAWMRGVGQRAGRGAQWVGWHADTLSPQQSMGYMGTMPIQ